MRSRVVVGASGHPVKHLAARGMLAGGMALVVLALSFDHADARRPAVGAKAAAESQKRQPERVPKGPLQIVISIADQRISVYDAAGLLARSAVSTGVPGHPTPMGVFTVIQKQRWHRSNLYSAAPMPYMQRITWSGVAMHEGVLPGHPASHGCIRLTGDFAVRLWHLTKLGVRVIIARSDVAPVEIAHGRLFAPKPMPDVSAMLPEPLKTALVGPEAGGIIKAVDSTLVEPSNAAAVGKPEGAAIVGDGAKVLPKPRKMPPISVFISRKQGKLLVREGYTPLFESPVTIANPDVPLGTHVFTAVEFNTDATAMRWTVVSLPREMPVKPELRKAEAKVTAALETKRTSRKGAVAKPPPPEPSSIERARAALDRIEIPKEARDRISELVSPASSVIVSDHELSEETDDDTDFIVLVH
jgi:L,D-transpeptidase catalytic domain